MQAYFSSAQRASVILQAMKRERARLLHELRTAFPKLTFELLHESPCMDPNSFAQWYAVRAHFRGRGTSVNIRAYAYEHMNRDACSVLLADLLELAEAYATT